MRGLTRLAIALGVGGLAGASAWWFYANMPASSHADIAQVHAAARMVLAGRDPYALIGPGRPFAWGYPLLYPLTAAIPLLPFAALSERVVTALWPAIGFTVLAFALTGGARPGVRLAGLLSVPALVATWNSQWSPLLTALVLLPPVAALAAAKPTVAVFLVAISGRRQWAWAVGGGLVLLAVTLAIDPTWPAKWRAALPAGSNNLPPVLRRGGVVLLLALVRWRQPEARLLTAMALAPQVPVFYEALPLILIPRTLREQLFLSVAGFAAWEWKNQGPIFIPTVQAEAYFDHQWIATMFGCYLPALLLVLWRSHTPSAPSAAPP